MRKVNPIETRGDGAPAPPVRVLLLGPMSIVRPDGEQVVGERQRAVLGVLAVHLGEVLPADRLIDRAWGGDPPKTAGAALRVHVSKLRAALSVGEIPLEHNGAGYCLNPSLVTTDIVELQALLDRIQGAPAAASAAAPAAVLALIEEALGLFRGDPLPDLRDEESRAEAEALTAIREMLREDQVEAMLELGQNAAAAVTAAELAHLDPLNERRTRQLMLALYRTGRQADALAAGGRLRDRLREDLGVDPDPETRALEVRILRQDQSLLLPRAGTPGPTRHRTPARPRRIADRISIPVRMLVAERLLDTPPATLELAGLVAVLDDLAYADVLAAASGLSATEVARGLRDLAGRNLIAPPDPDHPVTLQRPEFGTAIVDTLDGDGRARLHSRAADALGETLDPAAYALTAIAWHRLEAMGRPSTDSCATAGTEPVTAAVAQAAAGCLDEDFAAAAQELCEAALATTLPEHTRLDLLRLHVQALMAQGLVDRAEEEWAEAVEVARELADPERFALTVLTRTWVSRSVMVLTNLPEVLVEADRALAPGSSALRVRVQATLMLENTVPGRTPPTEAEVKSLWTAAEQVGDPESLRFVLFAEHARLRSSADAVRREAVGRELLQLSEGDPAWECRALAELAHDCFVRGRFDEVPAILERLEAASEQALLERSKWLRQLTLTSLHRDLGRFEEADREAESALLRGAAAGLPDAMAAEATHRLISLLLRDTTAVYLPVLERFRTVAPHNPVIPVAMGLALAQSGQPDEARARLDLVLPAVIDAPDTEFTLYILCIAAEAFWAGATMTPDLAARIHDRVLPCSGQFVAMGLVSSTIGPVDRILGQLSALAGDRAQARIHFTAAQEQAERAGSPVWQIRTAADRTLVETDSVAAALATEFQPLALGLGMQPSVRAFDRVRPAIA